MSHLKQSAYKVSLYPQNNKHSPLKLLDNIKLVLGRSELCKITEKRCSRQQIQVWHDIESNELVVQQLGANKSCVLHANEEHFLSQHSVKRFPLVLATKKPTHQTENGSVIKHSTIWLLGHPAKQYAYDVMVNDVDAATSSNHCDKNAAIECSGNHKRKLTSTLDSFVVKKNKDSEDELEGVWEHPTDSLYVYNTKGLKGSAKVAAFDMDGTLIVPASGAKWPKNKDDWTFMLPEVPGKLRQLHQDGYKLVIFTNQAGIGKGTVNPAEIQHKITAVVRKLKLPFQAIISASKKDIFRKPAPGMWDYMVEHLNDSIHVNLDQSLYIGDAAGRDSNWAAGKKKDFACSDRLFALNIGLSFHTPEAFFLSRKEPAFTMPEFNPTDVLCSKPLVDPPTASIVSDKQEVIVMVGFPGSGKSSFSKTHLSTYQRINRDTLGSWQKCVAKCAEALEAGKSVVIDNTNPDQESRRRYIDCANKKCVPVRCFMMATTYKHSRHNERFRQILDPKHSPINEMVMNSYKSKYSEPQLDEGFLEIVKVNFKPSFTSDKEKKIYMFHLLEK